MFRIALNLDKRYYIPDTNKNIFNKLAIKLFKIVNKMSFDSLYGGGLLLYEGRYGIANALHT